MTGLDSNQVEHAISSILNEVKPILLVTDDERHTLDNAVRSLQKLNANVISTSSAEEAERLCRTVKPAVIIMDADLGKDEEGNDRRNGVNALETINEIFKDDGVMRCLWTEHKRRFENLVAQRHIRVDSWLDDKELTDETLDAVRHLLIPLRSRIEAILSRMVEALRDRLGRYEKTFGDLDEYTEISSVVGEVEEVDPKSNSATVFFTSTDSSGERRQVSYSRLEAVEANFPGAQIRYSVHSRGQQVLSSIENLKTLERVLSDAKDQLRSFSQGLDGLDEE